MPGGRPKGQPHTGGRVAGTPNKVTAEIRELARVHGPAGVERLAEIAFGHPLQESAAIDEIRTMLAAGLPTPDIAKFARCAFASRPDITCVAAIKELFDRAYGKAPQPLAVGGDPNAPPVKTETKLIYSGVFADLDEKV